MNITLTLDQNEAVVIAQLLGKLPTESGVFPLFSKVRQQIEEQVNAPPQPPAEAAAPVEVKEAA